MSKVEVCRARSQLSWMRQMTAEVQDSRPFESDFTLAKVQSQVRSIGGEIR